MRTLLIVAAVLGVGSAIAWGTGKSGQCWDALAVHLKADGTTTTVVESPTPATGGADVAFAFASKNTFAASDKLVSFRNGASEKAHIDGNGNFTSNGGGSFSTLASILSLGNAGTTWSCNSAGVCSVLAFPYSVKGGVADGASAVGVVADSPSYTTDGAKLLSVRNNAVEKAYVSLDGAIRPQVVIAATTTKPRTCDTAHEGLILYSRDTDAGAGVWGSLCVCDCDGAGSPTCAWHKAGTSTACP